MYSQLANGGAKSVKYALLLNETVWTDRVEGYSSIVLVERRAKTLAMGGQVLQDSTIPIDSQYPVKPGELLFGLSVMGEAQYDPPDYQPPSVPPLGPRPAKTAANLKLSPSVKTRSRGLTRELDLTPARGGGAPGAGPSRPPLPSDDRTESSAGHDQSGRLPGSGGSRRHDIGLADLRYTEAQLIKQPEPVSAFVYVRRPAADHPSHCRIIATKTRTQTRIRHLSPPLHMTRR